MSHPSAAHGQGMDASGLIQSVQREVFPLDINYFRSEPVLQQSLERLNGLWPEVYAKVTGDSRKRIKAREAAAMAATARWMYAAALTRRETRGMHTLLEYPDPNPDQQHRLTVSGIDHIQVYPEGQPPRRQDEIPWMLADTMAVQGIGAVKPWGLLPGSRQRPGRWKAHD